MIDSMSFAGTAAVAAGAAAGRASRAGVAATAARASRRVRVRVPDGEGRSRPTDRATKDRAISREWAGVGIRVLLALVYEREEPYYAI